MLVLCWSADSLFSLAHYITIKELRKGGVEVVEGAEEKRKITECQRLTLRSVTAGREGGEKFKNGKGEQR